MKNIQHTLLVILCATFIFSCKKSSDSPATGTGKVSLEFDNRAGDAELVFGTTYTTAAGEQISFTKFNYYISNVVFIKADGSSYVVPKDSCYYLVQHDVEESRGPLISNIPAGDYTAIQFVLGVDSAKCAAPVEQRTGVLDPAGEGQDMYWSWNSGYIFLKTEGTSAQSTMENTFMYHVGGFGGTTSATINNIKTIKLIAPEDPIMVRTNRQPDIHMYVDAMKLFNGTTNISVASDPMVMFAPYSTTIANNYQHMFSINHVHND